MKTRLSCMLLLSGETVYRTSILPSECPPVNADGPIWQPPSRFHWLPYGAPYRKSTVLTTPSSPIVTT